MIGRLWLALALATTAATAALPLADGPVELDLRAAERQRLDQLGELGRRIYDFDRAARAAAEAMAAHEPSARQAVAKGGWIVEPAADGALSVLYYDRGKDRSTVLFSASWKGGKIADEKLIAPAAAPSLTPVEERMARARDVAIAHIDTSGFPRCSTKYTIVVLPPAAPDGPIPVYVLTPPDGPGTFPVGGHMRFDIGPDDRIVASRAYAKACLALTPERTPAGFLPGGRSLAMGTTHLLDAMPTELHAYMSSLADTPIFVGTPDDRFWLVDGPHIALVSRNGPAGVRPRTQPN